MRLKRIGLSGLVVALCGLGTVHAQAPAPGPDLLRLYSPNGMDSPSPYSPSNAPRPPADAIGGSTFAAVDGGSTMQQQQPQSVVLGQPASSWLVYPRSPGCCGPVGGCGGPLGYEVFARSGIAFPGGGGIFGNFLRPGWDIEGGGRLLLLNPAVNKAWTVSLSVSNIFNRTGNDNQVITLNNVPVKTTVIPPGSTNPTPVTVTVPHVPVTLSSLNQTFFNFGLGREWYLLGSADPGLQNGCNWRFGVDGGGRYGTADVQFNEIQHHTGQTGGMYAAIHTDVEYPWRCGILQAGIRYEYNYLWTHLLQAQNGSNYQSSNLLFQIGARF
jgi:hypothetical protein